MLIYWNKQNTTPKLVNDSWPKENLKQCSIDLNLTATMDKTKTEIKNNAASTFKDLIRDIRSMRVNENNED